jgi:hypothetical protein
MVAILDYGMGNTGSILNMVCRVGGKALRANNDETLPYAPDTMGKQESQSWQKSPRIVSIRLQTFLALLAGASATARSCALSRPRTGTPSLVN